MDNTMVERHFTNINLSPDSVRHRSMYKTSQYRDWKEEFRINCHSLLRERRSTKLNKARGFDFDMERKFLYDTMDQELNSLKLRNKFNTDELQENIEHLEMMKDEFIKEYEYLLQLEHERIDEEFKAYSSQDVLCPSCQITALSFPSSSMITCQRCNYTIALAEEILAPSKLIEYFTEIFSSHAQNCQQRPVVLVEGNQMITSCSECCFVQQIF